MKKIIITLVILLVSMEGVGWWVYKNSKKISSSAVDTSVTQPVASTIQTAPQIQSEQTKEGGAPVVGANDTQSSTDVPISGGDLASFPPPTVEKINGVVQRTIHMGVRQWAWDPSLLTVNYGEKVILIMHNADVPHSISIPDFNVKAAIPEEGAIVTFTASKKGTFDFFCDNPCGKGHSQMRGKITVS